MAKWKIKALVLKEETTEGTDAVPTAAADALLGYNVDLSPMEGGEYKREYESPFMGARGSVPIDLYQTLSFSVEMTPSGSAGVAPAYAAALRSCGVAQVIVATTSVTFSRVSSGHKSCSIYVWIDGLRYRLINAKGNAKLRWEKGQAPMIDFTFTGFFTLATDVANPTPALAAQLANKPLPVNSVNTPTFTVNGVSLAVRSVTLDLGNKVVARFLPRGDAVVIEDFEETIAMVVEATTMAAFNPYQLAQAQTDMALSLVHGLGAGKVTTLAVPTLQLGRPGKPQTSEGGIVEWSLMGMPKWTAGNDQFTLALT